MASALTQKQEVKGRRVAATGSIAAACAVRDADVDVVAIYPITPQTHIAEHISEMAANGEIDAEVIHVESEHSALSAVVAAAATGARVFTATASQGLELMHEILYIASGLRQPVVMALATRALSPPINIWNDYSDLASARDTGWIAIVSENVQEVYDNLIQAYYISEHPDVLLPTLVSLDGFILSHTVEPLILPSRDEVLSFIPKRPRGYRPVLDIDNPITMGPLATPEWYYEIKMQQIVAMRNASKVVEEAGREFGRRFGRKYGLVEPYMVEDADYIIVTMGAISGTAKAAASRLRKQGIKAGVLKIRVYRPFPADIVAEYLEKAKAVGVLDKAVLFGSTLEGPLAMDVIAALYTRDIRVPFASFVHGLGGRDIYVRDVIDMFKHLEKLASKGGIERETIYVGVKE